MKLFVVVASVLFGFLSAATHLTEEELKVQQQNQKVSAASLTDAVGTGTTGAAATHPIHDILSKLTTALSQAVAKNENLDSNDPLKSLMDSDFMKANGNGILSEVDPKLKAALGDFGSFKDLLNGKGDIDIGKMFHPTVLKDFSNGLKGGFKEDAHAAVDEELAKIFGMEKEKMTDYRARIFDKLNEVVKDGDLKIDDLFSDDMHRALLQDL